MVEQVLGCFLQQDFTDAELVILNDEPQQELVFDHPRVRIINLPKREVSLHQKRCTAISECRGEYLMTIDDDDLISPDRLSRAAKRIDKELWASDRYYIDSSPPKIIVGTMHWNFMLSMKLYIRLGGYNRNPNFGNDGARLKQKLEKYMQENGLKFDTGYPTILYRRYTTSISYTDKGQYMLFERQPFRTGRIVLEPKYVSKIFNEVARAATITQTKEECRHTNQNSLRRSTVDCI